VTTTQFEHEHPQYATHADLEAMEGRIINRISELETRMARDISAAFWRQLLVLLAVNITLILALAIPIINLGINIMATQATILSKLP